MKSRFLIFLSFLLLLFHLGSTVIADEPEIKVFYNNIAVIFDDQPPVLENGRVLVPMRKIFETVGASVAWSEATKTVTSYYQNKNIVMTVGSKTAKRNKLTILLDVPPRLINGRTMIPLRFASESLGLNVEWENSASTVRISDNDGNNTDPLKQTVINQLKEPVFNYIMLNVPFYLVEEPKEPEIVNVSGNTVIVDEQAVEEVTLTEETIIEIIDGEEVETVIITEVEPEPEPEPETEEDISNEPDNNESSELFVRYTDKNLDYVRAKIEEGLRESIDKINGELTDESLLEIVRKLKINILRII